MDMKIAIAEKAGGIMGMTILKNMEYSFNPSTRPASIRSRGTPSMYCLKKNIANGDTIMGRKTPQKVSIKEMLIMSLYRGRMRICIGTSMRNITKVVTIFLPLN
jgi:hypothetical protein